MCLTVDTMSEATSWLLGARLDFSLTFSLDRYSLEPADSNHLMSTHSLRRRVGKKAKHGAVKITLKE